MPAVKPARNPELKEVDTSVLAFDSPLGAPLPGVIC